MSTYPIHPNSYAPWKPRGSTDLGFEAVGAFDFGTKQAFRGRY